METPLPHDLHDFMLQTQHQMSAEYERISKRAAQDPGTAGDEGEENWAALLRDWLPTNYTVVTKGQIIGHDGVTSGQVDVIVLKGTYPKALINKKKYLAAGVAAAFECKNTLRANHIDKAVRTSADLKSLYPIREGSPYKELHSPVICGLLAHSHIWKGENSKPEINITSQLWEADKTHVCHPRLGLDLICVSDLCTWKSRKSTYVNPEMLSTELSEDALQDSKRMYPIPAAHTDYHQGPIIGSINEKGLTTIEVSSAEELEAAINRTGLATGTPIGHLISNLVERMAWENPDIADIASYFKQTGISGMAGGYGITRRLWPSSIYSEQIRSRVEACTFDNRPWSEWSSFF